MTVAALTGALHHSAGGGHGHAGGGHGHAGGGHGHAGGGHGHAGGGHGHAGTGHGHTAIGRGHIGTGHGHGSTNTHAQGHHASNHHTHAEGSEISRLAGVGKSTAITVSQPDRSATFLTYCNPTNIATFATWFGATGIVLWRLLPTPIEWTVPAAVVGGLIGAKLTMGLVGWIGLRMFESGSFSIQDVVGLQAEVTVPLSGQATGEIVYVKGGARYTASARLLKPEVALGRGAKAIICDMQDDVAYVEPWEES